jgi:CubicO group peptidase (beta-lactamase class C family)
MSNLGTIAIMKQFLSISFLLLLLGYSNNSLSQTDQQRNDIVFQKLKGFINHKSADSVYALLDDNFRKQVTPEAISSVLNNVYSLGSITNATETKFREGVSAYKVEYASGIQKVIIGADSLYRIHTLAFRPWVDESKIPMKQNRSATNNPLATQFDKQVDTIARRYIDRLNTVGLEIGIVKDGKIVTYGYGEVVKGSGKIPTANTIFEIGSITKTFTATLLAWHAEQGKVKLSDSIAKYLPDSVADNKELSGITLQMLSNHTSGLPRVPFNLALGGPNDDPYAEYDDPKLFYFLKNCELRSAPGTKYDYSNTAVALLGVILERVSGMAYEKMVKSVITTPLEMTHTVQHLPAAERETFTAVYDREGKEVTPWNFEAIAGAGCLRSTANDMLLYAMANMNNDSSPLSKAMSVTHRVTFDQGPKVGLGWHYKGIKDSPWLWHNGGTAGSSSFIAFNPDKKTAIVVLANSFISVDDLAKELTDIVK